MKIGPVRVIDTLNDALTIAGLEMLEQPHLNRPTTNKKRLLQRRAQQDRFRAKVVRRVLSSDLAAQDARADDQYYFLLQKVLRAPEDKLLPCVLHTKDCLQSLPPVLL